MNNVDPLQRVIDELKKTVEGAAKELENIELLKKQFPDLSISTNRWGKKFYTSKLVNSLATELDIYYNCGCCEDSPLEVSPYVRVNDTKVFTQPFKFCVGEQNRFYGDEEFDNEPKALISDNWKDLFRKQDVSEAVIKMVAKKLRAFNNYYPQLLVESIEFDKDAHKLTTVFEDGTKTIASEGDLYIEFDKVKSVTIDEFNAGVEFHFEDGTMHDVCGDYLLNDVTKWELLK